MGTVALIVSAGIITAASLLIRRFIVSIREKKRQIEINKAIKKTQTVSKLYSAAKRMSFSDLDKETVSTKTHEKSKVSAKPKVIVIED